MGHNLGETAGRVKGSVVTGACHAKWKVMLDGLISAGREPRQSDRVMAGIPESVSVEVRDENTLSSAEM